MGHTLYQDLYMFLFTGDPTALADTFYVLLYINIRCDDRCTLHGWPLAVD